MGSSRYDDEKARYTACLATPTTQDWMGRVLLKKYGFCNTIFKHQIFFSSCIHFLLLHFHFFLLQSQPQQNHDEGERCEMMNGILPSSYICICIQQQEQTIQFTKLTDTNKQMKTKQFSFFIYLKRKVLHCCH